MREAVLRAVAIVEESGRQLSLDDIAGRVYLSKYYLNRVFKALTGQGLIAYARSRHLARSLHDLLQDDRTIGEIALGLGYEQENSYTRAFRREFGLTPATFRRERPVLPVVGRITPSSLTSTDHGLICRPFNLHRPSFQIAGRRVRLSIDDAYYKRAAVSMASDFFYQHSGRILHPVEPMVYIGFSWWDEYHSGYSEYMSALEVDERSVVPVDMDRAVIPTADYAVFRYIGLHHPAKLTHQLEDIWSFVEYTWLTERGITRKDVCSFELVDMRLAKADYCQLDLHVLAK